MYEFKPHPRSSHSQIIELIPDGSTILDVGCSSGYLGSLLIKKGCVLYGIDHDKDALKKAAPYYTKTFLLDLEGPLPKMKEKFDIIIFADTLEHLRDPKKTLLSYSGFLKPGGKIILSLPNVANIYVRFHLLAGKWNYTSFGILDRTHVTFFTLKTARLFIQSNDFEIISWRRTPIPFDVASPRFSKKPLSLIHTLYDYLCRLWPSLFGYQFIFEIRKK